MNSGIRVERAGKTKGRKPASLFAMYRPNSSLRGVATCALLYAGIVYGRLHYCLCYKQQAWLLVLLRPWLRLQLETLP
jgi:hypothetical protein